MAYDRYGVLKVKGDPEVLWIAMTDSNPPKGSPFMTTSGDLDEAGVRKYLAEKGDPAAHIDALIAAARADWDAKHK
jgi:hypothetical protein